MTPHTLEISNCATLNRSLIHMENTMKASSIERAGHSSQREKRILGHELAGLIERALN